MDQHPFPLLHLSERMERIEGGRERQGDGRSILEAHVAWLERCEPLINRNVGGKAARLSTYHLVADGKLANPIADRDHAASTLSPKGRASRIVRHHLLGKDSHCKHQIPEVEAGSDNLDFDLVGFGRLAHEMAC